MLARESTEVKFLALMGFVLNLVSCGLDTDTFLNIDMYGIAVAPTDAGGNTSPYGMTITLASVSAVRSDGSNVSWELAEETEFIIIDRAQRVFQLDLANLEGESYSQINVAINTAYKFSVKDQAADLDGTLSTGAINYTGSAEVETGKDLDFLLKVSWLNTVQVPDDGSTGTIATEPTFELIKD